MRLRETPVQECTARTEHQRQRTARTPFRRPAVELVACNKTLKYCALQLLMVSTCSVSNPRSQDALTGGTVEPHNHWQSEQSQSARLRVGSICLPHFACRHLKICHLACADDSRGRFGTQTFDNLLAGERGKEYTAPPMPRCEVRRQGRQKQKHHTLACCSCDQPTCPHQSSVSPSSVFRGCGCHVQFSCSCPPRQLSNSDLTSIAPKAWYPMRMPRREAELVNFAMTAEG